MSTTSQAQILQRILSSSTARVALKVVGSEKSFLSATNAIGEKTTTAQDFTALRDFEKLKQRIYDPSLRPKAFQDVFADIRPISRRPRNYQTNAITKTIDALQEPKNNSRVSLAAACGSGKSLTSYWIAEELSPNLSVIFVPTRPLIDQTLRTWLQEFQSVGIEADFLAVASQLAVSALSSNKNHVSSSTTKKAVQRFVADANDTQKKKIIFATYASHKVVLDALKIIATAELQAQTDLFCDEAHRLTGEKDKDTSAVILDDSVRFRNRVFMSGSPKNLAYDETKISSYNKEIFGPIAVEITFKELVDAGVLADYQVHRQTDLASRTRVDELLKQMKQHGITSKNNPSLDFHVASLITGLESEPDIRKMVAFQPTIEDSKDFRELCGEVVKRCNVAFNRKVEFLHIDGDSTAEAAKTLDKFRNSSEDTITLLTNSKYFIEGLDVPEVDAVYLGSARSTGSAIAQIIGRATRLSWEGKVAKIFAPLPPEDIHDISDSYAHMILNLRYLRTAETFLQDSIGTKHRGLPIEAQTYLIHSLPTQSIHTFDELSQFLAESVDVGILQKLTKSSGNEGFKFYKHLHGLIEVKLGMEGSKAKNPLPTATEVYDICQERGFDELLGKAWKPGLVFNVTKDPALRKPRKPKLK